MADQKISQLAAAAALTGTELVPIVQSSSTVSTTPAAIKTYATAELVSTYGFGNTSRDVPDLTAVAGNYSQIGRLLSGATGGPGVISGFVALPMDGTPTTAYVAAGSGRLWIGYKSSSGGTPTWTEFAKLASPTFSGQVNVAGNATGATSYSVFRNTGAIQSDVVNAVSFDSLPSTAASATTTTLAHYRAQGATLGASATLTAQYGFRILSNLTAATNNYGFQSDLAAAANVWHLYLSGTAQNYVRGKIGVGSGKTLPVAEVDVNGQVAQSAATSITAAGTNLATATQLTATFNVVSTTPSGTGVILPNVIGTAFWVHNAGANALLVYPPTGTVNGTASHSLATTAKMQYIQITSGVWYTMS
jgi:hypothetical protein